MVDVLFLATWHMFFHFGKVDWWIWRSQETIYDQHNNMKRSGCDDKTWTDESSVCKACFLLACCTDSGILPLFTLNNYKYVIVIFYIVLRFCSLPTWCFFKTWHKDPGTLNNQYFNGKVRNCVFFWPSLRVENLILGCACVEKNWNCVDQPHSIHPWDWYIYLHVYHKNQPMSSRWIYCSSQGW